MNKTNVNYSLYLVTDRDLLKEISLEQAVEQAILGGATLVQLREKNISSLEFYNAALEVKAVTDRYEIPLIINDRLDIALAADASGVHVGQSDMPACVARRLLGAGKLLGVSAASVEEALKAEMEGADYIGVGAVFPTDTKKDAEHASLEDLRCIKNKVSIPIVAIGGINEGNITKTLATGVDGVAVVSAILAGSDIKKSANNLKNLIDNFREV